MEPLALSSAIGCDCCCCSCWALFTGEKRIGASVVVGSSVTSPTFGCSAMACLFAVKRMGSSLVPILGGDEASGLTGRRAVSGRVSVERGFPALTLVVLLLALALRALLAELALALVVILVLVSLGGDVGTDLGVVSPLLALDRSTGLTGALSLSGTRSGRSGLSGILSRTSLSRL